MDAVRQGDCGDDANNGLAGKNERVSKKIAGLLNCRETTSHLEYAVKTRCRALPNKCLQRIGTYAPARSSPEP